MGALTIADISGDGQRDLFFWNQTTPNTVSMLINQGNGTFGARIDKPMVGGPGVITAVDVDVDGDLDLAFPYGSQAIGVARNLGNLNFAAVASMNAGAPVTEVIAADITKDGKPELIATTYDDTWRIAVLENNGNGSFSAPAEYFVDGESTRPKVIDVDSDGSVDLAFANNDGAHVVLLRNTGSGIFDVKTNLPEQSRPYLVMTADVSGDGQSDLISTRDSNVEVRINQGAGQFPANPTLYPATSAAQYAATGDFNGDGRLDIVISMSSSGSIGIFLNQNGGTFAPMISHPIASPKMIAAHDLNGDGLDDIVVTSTTSNDIQVLMNQGMVTFAVTKTIPGDASSPLALGDVDGDGWGDIAVAQASPTSQSAAVMLGLGNGDFGLPSLYPLGAYGEFVALQDLDADGFPELLVDQAYSAYLKAPQPTQLLDPTLDSHTSVPSNKLSVFHNGLAQVWRLEPPCPAARPSMGSPKITPNS